MLEDAASAVNGFIGASAPLRIPDLASPTVTVAPLVAAVVALLGTLGAAGAAVAESLPIVLPPGFRVELVADGLGAPRMLALDAAGTLLASIPDQGRIVALPAVARREPPSSPITVVAGLRLPHGLAVRGRDLWVAETGRVLRFRYDATTHRATEPVVVIPDLPAGAHHWTRSIAFGPGGRLFVAIGSSCDICREADRRRATIVSYAPDGSSERLVARGLRNPVGLAFDPTTGALWTTVNERDWRDGRAPPDFLARVRDGADYGWPDCYARDGAVLLDPEFRGASECRNFTLPTVELPPHAAPLGLAFYTGTRFPAAYRGNLFVALHGSRAELPPVGYKIVRVVLAADRRPRVDDFATNWRTGDRVWGRPVDVLVGRDGVLYVSDDHGGRVLRITAVR
jgi:glucose/arabinose dehydrogenase